MNADEIESIRAGVGLLADYSLSQSQARAAEAKARAAEDAIYLRLRKLSVLPKVHWSSGLYGPMMARPGNPVLHELARIMGSVTVTMEAQSPSLIRNAVATEARLGLYCFPFRNLGKEQPDLQGEAFLSEIARFRTQAQWVTEALNGYPVSMVTFEAENWDSRNTDPAFRAAASAAMDAIHIEAITAFPAADIRWYGR
ncbi:MAG: hypothetical protein PHU85_13705, partial [Phycisphaerae bacterium]|nr:hypothetical protein [Phycisphaerae bacterium]